MESQRKVKSDEWFIINKATRVKTHLYKGDYTIGRISTKHMPNDWNITSDIGKTSVSRRHCVIKLEGNRVSLHNKSKHGTYVNGLKIELNESIELKSEDDISLLDTAVLGTEEERNEMAHVSFKLQRILPVILLRIQTTPIRDDESTDNVLKIDIDNKKHKVKDEVKVKAKDNNNNNRIDKTMTHKYAEDYEQGEPSGVNCTKQKAPKNLKPPTDPVSKIMAQLEQKSKEKPRRIPNSMPSPPAETASSGLPKTMKRSLVEDPFNSSSTTEAKRIRFESSILLTPPSDDVQPMHVAHTRDLVGSIINSWIAQNILNSHLRGNVDEIPEHRFADQQTHESVLVNWLKTYIWHRIFHNSVRHTTSISVTLIQEQTDRIICKCTSEGTFKNGDVIILKAGDSADRQCFGYVTDVTDACVEIEVGKNYSRVVEAKKLNVIAQCNIANNIKLYPAITRVRQSNLFQNIITPRQQDCVLNQKNYYKWSVNLSHEQGDVFWKIYNGIATAYAHRSIKSNAFVSVVNGGPGTGKSQLIIETIVALVKSFGKAIKILVTGPTDNVVDSLALKLHQTRSHTDISNIPFLFADLAFVRLGHFVKRHPYQHVSYYLNIAQNRSIVFTSIGNLQDINYDRFDVVLFDNASESAEMYSTLPLLFKPSAFVLFGDRFRKPSDPLDLERKYPRRRLMQSMFQRLYASRQSVLELNYTSRFAEPVLRFLNQRFYNNTLRPRRDLTVDKKKSFAVFHGKSVDFQHSVLSTIFSKAIPSHIFKPTENDYSYAVILPPNISEAEKNARLGNYKNHLRTTTNQNFFLEPMDVLIVWVSDSMLREPRYRIRNLIPALTRAKRMIFFIGRTDHLAHPHWSEIMDYAQQNAAIHNLDEMNNDDFDRIIH